MEQLVFGILWCTFVPILFIIGILFRGRRFENPVDSRYPQVAFISHNIVLTYITIICIQHVVSGVPCWMRWWNLVVVGLAFGVIYCVRALGLVAAMELAIAKMMVHAEAQDSVKRLSSFVEDLENRNKSKMKSGKELSLEEVANIISGDASPQSNDTEPQSQSLREMPTDVQPSHATINANDDPLNAARLRSVRNSSLLVRIRKIWSESEKRTRSDKRFSLENRKMFSIEWLSFGGLVGVVVVASAFAVITSMFPLDSDVKVNDEACMEHHEFIVVWGVCWILCVGFLSYLSFRLVDLIDDFGIRLEMIGSAVTLMCGSGLFAAFYVEHDVHMNEFPCGDLFLLIMGVCLSVFSIVIPYASAVHNANMSDVDAAKIPVAIATLEGILQHSFARMCFERWLIMEHSPENLAFYDSVEEYKKMARRCEKEVQLFRAHASQEYSYKVEKMLVGSEADLAVTIFEKYVQKGAPLEVNLPGEIYDELASVVQEWKDEAKDRAQSMISRSSQGMSSSALSHSAASRSESGKDSSMTSEQRLPDLSRITSTSASASRAGQKITANFFDSAQANIYRLIQEDSFGRFRTTPTYRELARVVDDEILVSSLRVTFNRTVTASGKSV